VVIALYILGILAIIGIILYMKYRIFLTRMEEIVIWYVEVNPSDVFYIPERIEILRKKIGERAFKLTLKSVDKKRYNL